MVYNQNKGFFFFCFLCNSSEMKGGIFFENRNISTFLRSNPPLKQISFLFLPPFSPHSLNSWGLEKVNSKNESFSMWMPNLVEDLCGGGVSLISDRVYEYFIKILRCCGYTFTFPLTFIVRQRKLIMKLTSLFESKPY